MHGDTPHSPHNVFELHTAALDPFLKVSATRSRSTELGAAREFNGSEFQFSDVYACRKGKTIDLISRSVLQLHIDCFDIWGTKNRMNQDLFAKRFPVRWSSSTWKVPMEGASARDNKPQPDSGQDGNRDFNWVCSRYLRGSRLRGDFRRSIWVESQTYVNLVNGNSREVWNILEGIGNQRRSQFLRNRRACAGNMRGPVVIFSWWAVLRDTNLDLF